MQLKYNGPHARTYLYSYTKYAIKSKTFFNQKNEINLLGDQNTNLGLFIFYCTLFHIVVQDLNSIQIGLYISSQVKQVFLL